MVTEVIKYTCDACKKEENVKIGGELQTWTRNTEVGDLCPACKRAWDELKESFIIRMRKENGENLV